MCPACVPLAAVEHRSPCPECPGELRLLRDRRGGLYYRCDRAPKCGCTRGSALDGTPSGPVAVAALRELRTAVRKGIEALARDTGISRLTAYRKLAAALAPADPDAFRVADLDDDGCRAAVDTLNNLATDGLLGGDFAVLG